MLYVINYADEKYEMARKMNTKSAYFRGKCDRVIEYSPASIDLDFRNKNKVILDNERGGGYWLWKPYIIDKTLALINDGDYLFYCDAASVFINPISELINLMHKYKQSILLFELPFKEKQFTKWEIFHELEADETIIDQNQYLASFILIQKNNYICNFIKEWLTLSQNYLLISDKISLPQDPLFYQCRHDQSILSVLAKKYSIIPFRDPSQFGKYDYYEFQVRKWAKDNNIIMNRPMSKGNKHNTIFLHRHNKISYIGVLILYMKYRIKYLFCSIKGVFDLFI